MRMHSPSLSELHAFAAAARLGSYSLAAQELYVTQGGISRAIARLEEHLGFALFERLGRRNALTAAGQDYLQAIEPAVMAIEAASAAARRRRHGPQLRLSVIPTLFSHWLIPRLPDFNRRHPQIMLSFAPYRRDDPLNAPEIDAWIRVGSQHWPAGVEAEYVIGRDLIPICHPRELQGPNPIRSEQDLLNRPLLFHTNYPGNWASWMQARGMSQSCPPRLRTSRPWPCWCRPWQPAWVWPWYSAAWWKRISHRAVWLWRWMRRCISSAATFCASKATGLPRRP